MTADYHSCKKIAFSEILTTELGFCVLGGLGFDQERRNYELYYKNRLMSSLEIIEMAFSRSIVNDHAV